MGANYPVVTPGRHGRDRTADLVALVVAACHGEVGDPGTNRRSAQGSPACLDCRSRDTGEVRGYTREFAFPRVFLVDFRVAVLTRTLWDACSRAESHR